MTADTHDDDTKYAAKRAKSEAPDYALQEYWEGRYRRHFAQSRSDTAADGGIADVLPYHAWYFTYEDLRPLLLPLVLGSRTVFEGILEEAEEGKEENHKQERKSESDQTGNRYSTQETHVKTCSLASSSEDDENSGVDSIGNGDITEEECEDSDEIEREGLSKNGPISIVEIGCGDVPLGSSLAEELMKLEGCTGASILQVVKQIVCIDYSPTVIEAMQSKYTRFKQSDVRDASTNPGHIPLSFLVADARDLSQQNRTVELVLEKGTLDAMLSDNTNGVSSCIQVVAECARILSINGYFLLVSHLNAQTDQGITWLSNVLFEGLRRGDSDVAWSVEVHGNEATSDDSTGPCVYIIHKKAQDDVANEETSIPVKFFSY